MQSIQKRHMLLGVAGLALSAFAATAIPGCADQCAFDADCGAGEVCLDGSCGPIDPAELTKFQSGACANDSDCSAGEICYNRTCTDVALAANPTTCPEAPASDELVCTNWDQQECPCYAGEVAFHEKEEGGRLSCAGVVGIFSDRVKIKQVGCHIDALGGELSGDAVGFGELKLRIAQLPNDTSCSALADRWTETAGTDGSPAVRITCSATCKIWMEQFLKPTPERIVPDGSFYMGTSEANLENFPDGVDESPEHLVDITCFYMDRFEVSRGEYKECLDKGACENPDYAGAEEDKVTFFSTAKTGQPIAWVNHRQAEQYCKFRDKALPTEAEWERAARGSRWAMTHYPWGDEPPFTSTGAEDCEKVNFAGCANAPLPTTNGGGQARDDDDVGVHAKPDGASFFDMIDLPGNVREWTRDYYRRDVYQNRAASSGIRGAKNPEQLEPSDGLRARVVRGGSYLTEVNPADIPPRDALRTSDRDFVDEVTTAPDLGFRCVRYKPGVAR